MMQTQRNSRVALLLLTTILLFVMFMLMLLASILTTSPLAIYAQPADRAELIGYAVLPADTFADGPASGRFNGDGSKAIGPRFPS